MAKVFVNINQELLKEQKNMLTEKFGNWEVISVPNRQGVNQKKHQELMKTTRSEGSPAVFFLNTNASLLLAELAYWNGFDYGNSFYGSQPKGAVYFFIEDEENKWTLRDLTELV